MRKAYDTTVGANLSVAGNLTVGGTITGAPALSGGTINNATITGGTITDITPLAIADGGTGASTPAGARANLGLGTMATQNANGVAITGGSITNITDLAVADGGTGASTAAAARTNLGATSVGNNLFTAVDAAAGRTALGATLTGSALFTATDAAAGRAALGSSAFGSSIFIAADASAGRSLLGLGTMATQNGAALSLSLIPSGSLNLGSAGAPWNTLYATTIVGNVTGGATSVPATGISGTVEIAQGGTGATTAAAARTNLGLGTAAVANIGSGGAGTVLQSASAPTTAGQALVWDGTVWAPGVAGGGGVSSIGGSAASPGLRTATSATTGFYDNSTTNFIGFATNGVAQMTLSGTSATNGVLLVPPRVSQTGVTASTTLFGSSSGNSTMTGAGNTAMGSSTLTNTTTGGSNVAVGASALYNNMAGNFNVAMGRTALYSNTSGGSNTAIGYSALTSNVSSDGNTAVGYTALNSATRGLNTGVGMAALFYNATGSRNTALGYNAGPSSGSTGLSNTIALGFNASVTASNTFVIGSTGTEGIASVILPASSNTTGASLDMSARTDSLSLPRGTTTERPLPIVGGMMRFNTTTNAFEGHNGTAWGNLLGDAAGSSYVKKAGDTMTGNLVLNSTQTEIHFKDTDQRSGMIGVDGGLFYVGRADGANVPVHLPSH